MTIFDSDLSPKCQFQDTTYRAFAPMPVVPRLVPPSHIYGTTRKHRRHPKLSAETTDFVAIGLLPRREDGEIDWLTVPEETRFAFWRSHKRTWIEPILVNFDDDTPEVIQDTAIGP